MVCICSVSRLVWGFWVRFLFGYCSGHLFGLFILGHIVQPVCLETEHVNGEGKGIILVGLEFFWPRMALIDGQDVQGGHGLTLVPLGHPGAVFEAIWG